MCIYTHLYVELFYHKCRCRWTTLGKDVPLWVLPCLTKSTDANSGGPFSLGMSTKHHNERETLRCHRCCRLNVCDALFIHTKKMSCNLMAERTNEGFRVLCTEMNTLSEMENDGPNQNQKKSNTTTMGNVVCRISPIKMDSYV